MHDDIKLLVARHYAEYVSSVVRSKNLLEQEIEMLRAQLLPGGVQITDKVSTSATADSIPNGVIKLQDMIADFCTKQVEYVEVYRQMHDALEKIDVIPREALTMHYLHLWKWEKVCVEMDYTYDGIMRIRRRGLIDLYDHMPPEHKGILPKAL